MLARENLVRNDAGAPAMLTLYSYPELFGGRRQQRLRAEGVLPSSSSRGLPFVHEAYLRRFRRAARQLPYIVDDGETIGDSETIIAHLTRKYRLTIDAALTPAQRMTDHLVTRMLDDLYWVMSYSRWKDDRYFPLFRDGFMAQHSGIDAAGLDKAREYNAQRYHFQGIGRYVPDQAYARGVADLRCWRI